METINSQKLHEKDTLNVPNEMIENILVRLPVKSLLRFKAVSKKWEATISDPVFAQTHLQQSKHSDSAYKYLLTKVREPPSEEFVLAELKNQEFQVKSLLKNPNELGDAYFVSYLDGMLLLQFHKRSIGFLNLYALWNPSTTIFTRFICPYSMCYDPSANYRQYCGLCYDQLIEDYKVIIGELYHYVVFNCRNKRWTEVKMCPIDGIYEIDSPQGIYFKGSLYWVWEKYSNRYDRYADSQIVCFNSRDDEFEEVHHPKDIQHGDYPLRLALLGGYLCVYYYHESSLNKLSIVKIDDDRNSWIEFITIDMTPVRNLPYPYSLFMTDDNEIIIYFPQCVMVYYPTEDTFREIGNSSRIRHIRFPFVESLVSGFGDRRRVGRQRKFQFDELREVFFLM